MGKSRKRVPVRRSVPWYEQDLSDDIIEFEHETDCDVFTMFPKTKKNKLWNSAVSKFQKKINKYLSKRKKACVK